MNIISQYIPLNKINGEIKSILVSLSNFEQYELPFWGMKSDSGVFENSLRFWIGKAFLKTKRPQVVLKMMNQSAYLEGTLSKKALKWKYSLLRFLNSCFPLDQTKKQSKVEILYTYQLLYSKLYTQQLEFNEDEMVDFHHLLSYQNKMNDNVKFCTFLQNEEYQYNPLIWIQFPENQYKLKFKLQQQEYRFAKSIHMKFLDKQIEEDKEVDCGVSLAYVSFKGACFNEFSMNYIKLKQ